MAAHAGDILVGGPGEPEPGFTSEDGHRTFALSEIMVRQEMTGRGIAHALDDELLGARHEKRDFAGWTEEHGRLLCLHSWGWRTVARLRPGWPDAPLFDGLILPLPLNDPRGRSRSGNVIRPV